MSADHPPSRGTLPYGRLLAVSAGLGVAVLAAAAFTVTYADLRALALAGGAARHWAPAYPVMVDALITVTVLALVIARRTRWWSRALRWLLLAALLAGAAAASIQRAIEGYASLPDTPLKAGVAAAPYVTLGLAVWLWLTMFKQLKAPEPAARNSASADKPRWWLFAEPAAATPEDGEDAPAVDRAEDPDAGDDVIFAGSPPPASSLRSSPMPPVD